MQVRELSMEVRITWYINRQQYQHDARKIWGMAENLMKFAQKVATKNVQPTI
jgi:hypothetical protein